MKATAFALLAASALFASAALAAPADDVTRPVRQFLDGFNTGDTKSAYAAFAAGDIAIVDEFAPHLWVGPNAARNWAADYDKHAQATGVSDGLVKYGSPTRTEIEGDAAYVVIPTVYSYKEHGQPIAEKGQMVFALRGAPGAWKIGGWTWTGTKPKPVK